MALLVPSQSKRVFRTLSECENICDCDRKLLGDTIADINQTPLFLNSWQRLIPRSQQMNTSSDGS